MCMTWSKTLMSQSCGNPNSGFLFDGLYNWKGTPCFSKSPKMEKQNVIQIQYQHFTQ